MRPAPRIPKRSFLLMIPSEMKDSFQLSVFSCQFSVVSFQFSEPYEFALMSRRLLSPVKGVERIIAEGPDDASVKLGNCVGLPAVAKALGHFTILIGAT